MDRRVRDIPNGGGGGEGVGPVDFEGGDVFVATYLAQGSSRPIAVTGTTVYWLENSGTGGMRLMKKAKPQ